MEQEVKQLKENVELVLGNSFSESELFSSENLKVLWDCYWSKEGYDFDKMSSSVRTSCIYIVEEKRSYKSLINTVEDVYRLLEDKTHLSEFLQAYNTANDLDFWQEDFFIHKVPLVRFVDIDGYDDEVDLLKCFHL